MKKIITAIIAVAIVVVGFIFIFGEPDSDMTTVLCAVLLGGVVVSYVIRAL